MSKQPILVDEFVSLIAEHQTSLKAFIYSSVGDSEIASDILQQANVTIWQKSGELDSAEGFLPWAITIARYKVLSHVRDSRRERLVFYPELTEAMVELAIDSREELSDRMVAIHACLTSLPEHKLELLKRRYAHDESIKQIAAKTGCSVDSVKGRLKRLRTLLSDCVDRRLASAAQGSAR